MQQVVQPRASANGFGRRKVDREMGSRLDSRLQTRKANFNRPTGTGILSGNKGGGYGSSSRERLVYLTTCLIGHNVEVQVIDGSVFSGIFHATNADKDFGVILKMAHLVKAGSSRGQKNMLDSVCKPPSKTLIIPAKELVQIIAKGVSATMDVLTNEAQHERQQDIMTDSFISQSHHVEAARELERWVPGEDDPECPELENIFDGPWNRGWDQFEANETLFGVKSTFNEELYTTKLERGPQMIELEREASRIAGEIEGEDTQDLHLAEERGINLDEHFEIDEETRFSSVHRLVDDNSLDDAEDIFLDSHNMETFGGASGSILSMSFTDLTRGKINDGVQVSSGSSSMNETQSSELSTSRDLYHAGSDNHAQQLSSERISKSISAFDGESRFHDKKSSEQHAVGNCINEDEKMQMSGKEIQMLRSEDSQLSHRLERENFDKGALSPNAAAYAPSDISSKGPEKMSCLSEPSEIATCVKPRRANQSINSHSQLGSSTSSTSDCGGATSASSGPGLSPCSSVGSLSSEKSTLNPHAKEFKLNPNAKSFIPSQIPLRPVSPVSDGSFYYPANVTAVPHVHGMPVGIGIGPSFAASQPVIFNQPAAPVQSPQAYFHPNGPQYGQQMILGHPRQVLYMPTYPPETRRDF